MNESNPKPASPWTTVITCRLETEEPRSGLPGERSEVDPQSVRPTDPRTWPIVSIPSDDPLLAIVARTDAVQSWVMAELGAPWKLERARPNLDGDIVVVAAWSSDEESAPVGAGLRIDPIGVELWAAIRERAGSGASKPTALVTVFVPKAVTLDILNRTEDHQDV